MKGSVPEKSEKESVNEEKQGPKTSNGAVKAAYIGLISAVIVAIIGLGQPIVTKLSESRFAPTFTPTPTATSTPTSTLTLTPSPTSTDTPTPTFAPSPTPTDTPTSMPTKCQTDYADDIFKKVLAQDRELAQALGSRKLPRPICVWGSYMTFDTGLMIWRADSLDIYAIFADESWEAFEDSWMPGMPELSCDSEPPEGRFQPAFGFGKVWCDNQHIRDALGFATLGQDANRDLALQSFDRGWLILIDDTIYALISSDGHDNGTWASPDPYDYETIPLKSQSELSSPETNLGLGPGIKHLPETNRAVGPGLNPLSGIPFDIGWKATTQCSHVPDRPTHIQLNMNIANPVSVHLLLQAGYGLVRYKDAQIGKVSLALSDGSSPPDVPLILGFNTRDWAQNRANAVTTASASTLQSAWEGPAPDGTPGRMDILTIDIPDSYSQSTLESIQILDVSSSTTGDVDPCIHLLAVTVRYLR